MPVPGPAVLGRGVVILDGAGVPAPWAGSPLVRIDDAVLADPAVAVGELHEAWASRHPVVIALAVDPARFREPEAFRAEPWTLTPRFEVWLDRLHFLVWANTYDARAGEPRWWWSRKATRLGASDGGPADVILPDGQPAWIDGGPRCPLTVDHVLVHAESIDLGRLTPTPPPVAPRADLASDQLVAVAHLSGPARVVAPAGSGKTRVLTERLRHLLVDRGVEPATVLAVAYNKKAQEELEARCAGLGARVRTLNALGYALLARGGARPPRVLDEREVRRLVEALVPTRPRRSNTDPLAPYIEALSLVRLGLRDPADVEADRDDVPGLAEAFPRYRKAMSGEGAIDFDEQIYAAIELLLADGPLRRQAQSECRHLLVDEFQDLTPAHVLLLRLLAMPALDVFGVGDDDQVIYGHAGADPGFLTDFPAYFPAAGVYALEVNYRSPRAAVDAAVHLLSYNRRRVPKQIHAGPGAAEGSDRLEVRTHRSEDGATAVAALVADWLGEPTVAPEKVAVLTRVNSLLLAPHLALAEAGVPIDSVLRPTVLERTGVRAALAYLRIASAPASIRGADVVEILRRPSRGLPQWFPDRLRRRAGWTLRALRDLASTVPDKEASKVERLADDLEMVVRSAHGTTRQVLAVIKDGVGLGRAMGLLDGTGGGEGSSHLDDLEALEQVAELHPDPATFETWLRNSFQRESTPCGVTLSTVHRVKGMEWDRVAVFGANDGIWPHRLAADEEEERRVLHVAITRGRQRVVVLADTRRPSPFLAELTGQAPHRRAAARTPVAPVPRRAKVAAIDEALSPDAQRREDALRVWRRDRCKRDKVPAYVVFQDLVLRAVARSSPTTLEELAKISGIGPTRLELYGDEVLAVLESVS